jgi:hypothetical protein
MSPREQRIIRNEALFREVNAHIADLEDRLRSEAGLMPLICECANTGCTTVIEVDPGTFRTVREDPQLFLVAPGHELAEEETVVGRGAGYFIVEKQLGQASPGAS